MLLPVALRNLLVGGTFLLTTSGAGTNLYGGNNLENPYGRATEFSFLRGVPEHEAGDWRREAERRVGHPLDPGDVSAFWRDETFNPCFPFHVEVGGRIAWVVSEARAVTPSYVLMRFEMETFVDVLNVLALRTTTSYGVTDGQDFGVQRNRMAPFRLRFGVMYRY